MKSQPKPKPNKIERDWSQVKVVFVGFTAEHARLLREKVNEQLFRDAMQSRDAKVQVSQAVRA